MSTFQNKVLRLFTGPNTSADWHVRADGYSKDEVASIKDPAAGSRKEITSIPSPFARVHLFENAFEWVANRARLAGIQTLTEKNAYHQLVSDALDVAEVFFNYEVFNKTQPRLRFVVWNKRAELENLKSRPEHRLFGETLELFLGQDNTKTRFDQVDNIYLLYWDDTLLGGSSPSTLFFAAHNEGFRLARLGIVRGDDVLFDHEPNPLYNRSLAFQRYLYGLFILYPTLQKAMSPLWRYMGVCYDVLKAQKPEIAANITALLQMRDFNIDSFNAEFKAATTGETNAFIDVLRGIHHRRLNSGDISHERDDFAIKTDKSFPGRRPLVLQNSFHKALSYCGGKWSPDIEVPNFVREEMEQRRLPRSGDNWPFLVVSDFLEPNIMRVPFPLDEEHFFNGNPEGFRKSDRSLGDKGVPGDDAFLLPLTRRFFEYFNPDYLLQLTREGTPVFRMIKTGDGGVEVRLLVPIKSGDYIEFKRLYRPNAASDLAKNEGAVAPCQFDLGLYPLFHVDGQVRQIAVLADGDTLPTTKQYDYNLEFYQRDGKAVTPGAKRTRQDKHRHQQFVTTKYFSVDTMYDYIQVSNGEHLGVVIPKWKQKSKGNKPVTVAVDFGTTNSFLGFAFADEEPRPLEISQKERFLITLSEDWVPVMMKETILRTLSPYTLGQGQECWLPMRTIVSEIQGINYHQAIPGMDMSVPFFFERRLLLKNEEWVTNIKWVKMSDAEGTMNNRRVETYLGMMLFMARNYILMHGGDLDNCKLVWLYPTSMGDHAVNLFEKTWKRAAEQYLGAGVRVGRISEGVAPYYSFSDNEIKGGEYPVLNVDIGGGTTDVIIFRKKKPVFSTSFRFAGNTIFGNGYGNPKSRVNGLFRLFRDTIDTWFEANKGKIYNLHDAYRGENVGIINMGSADINSFWFSIETNKEVRDNNVRPVSYADLLSERDDVKVVFLVFFSAIVYHLAHVMKQLGQPMPRQIAFSGKGAGIISLLDADPRARNAAGLAALIFRKVYGAAEYHPEGLDILLGSNPKERTTFGALNMARAGNLEIAFQNAVLILSGAVPPAATPPTDPAATPPADPPPAAPAPFLTVDNIRKQEPAGEPSFVAYKDLTKAHYDQLEQEVRYFLDFFFDLNKEYPFSKFGALTGDKLQRCKEVLRADLRSNLENGLDARLETVDLSEHITEPLFFYPLSGALFQLMDYFADEAGKPSR